MSRTLNKVMLIGNIGKKPDLKFTPSGIPVTSFRLATSEGWKDKDGIFHESTDWHTIVAWRGLAEVITKIAKKGSRVFVEGKLQTRDIEDKAGIKKHVVEILADNLLLIDNKKKDEDEDDEEYSFREAMSGTNGSDYDDDDYSENGNY